MSTQINSINSFYSTAKPKELNTKLDNIDNRIIDNNRQIVLLENQITAQKQVSSITREMITNNTNRINTIKEIINNNEKIIGVHKEHRGLLQESRDLLQESRNLTKESRDLLQESRDLLQESRDLLQESRDVIQKMIDCVEKMLVIIAKNPVKYSKVDKNQFQQLAEIIEIKKKLTEITTIKLKQYPKENHESLMDTAKKVIDNSFYAINTIDLSYNKKIFFNLENNIDAALAKLYTTIKSDHKALPFKNYRIMQNLFYNFSNLSIENFKI